MRLHVRWALTVALLTDVVGCLHTPASASKARNVSSDMQELLDMHNIYRCMHDAPPLVWDPEVAANAQDWADQGIFDHSTQKSRMLGRTQVGENLAWGYTTPRDAVKAWYCEILCTNPYGQVQHFTDSVHPDESVGHYTQVVWKGTRRLGCAKGVATIGTQQGNLWVCQYAASGNWRKKFQANVLAPTKDLSGCPPAGLRDDAATCPENPNCPASWGDPDGGPPDGGPPPDNREPYPDVPTTTTTRYVPTTGSQYYLDDAELQEVLDMHNVYRCIHGLTPLKWDEGVARSAQNWANMGVYEHSPEEQRKVYGMLVGENLAWGYHLGSEATKAWYCEVLCTDPYGTADSFTDSKHPDESIGHYTQVVWRDTTKLGCGKGYATVGGQQGPLLVCQYSSAGNYESQFQQNVNPPANFLEDCQAAWLHEAARTCPENPHCPLDVQEASGLQGPGAEGPVEAPKQGPPR